jgi:hypothetical protein
MHWLAVAEGSQWLPALAEEQWRALKRNGEREVAVCSELAVVIMHT